MDEVITPRTFSEREKERDKDLCGGGDAMIASFASVL